MTVGDAADVGRVSGELAIETAGDGGSMRGPGVGVAPDGLSVGGAGVRRAGVCAAPVPVGVSSGCGVLTIVTAAGRSCCTVMVTVAPGFSLVATPGCSGGAGASAVEADVRGPKRTNSIDVTRTPQRPDNAAPHVGHGRVVRDGRRFVMIVRAERRASGVSAGRRDNRAARRCASRRRSMPRNSLTRTPVNTITTSVSRPPTIAVMTLRVGLQYRK